LYPPHETPINAPIEMPIYHPYIMPLYHPNIKPVFPQIQSNIPIGIHFHHSINKKKK
jgi:hypothetical protein